MLFCDTSTLAKYYVPERESQVVRARLDSEDYVFLSELARVELLAVFHRRLRESRWTRVHFLAALRQFQQDEASQLWEWLPVSNEVIQHAAQVFTTLPEEFFLRAADCLHLVTVVENGFSEIHTHDAKQSNGAHAFGLTPVQIR